jgi:hypothetical protein
MYKYYDKQQFETNPLHKKNCLPSWVRFTTLSTACSNFDWQTGKVWSIVTLTGIYFPLPVN